MAFANSTIEVFALDGGMNIVAVVDDFISLTATKVLNDVGTWELTISEASKNAQWFEPDLNPGGGIMIRRNGSLFMSGINSEDSEEWSDEDNQNGVLTFSGVDHNFWIFSRLIYPNPFQTPATMTDVFYQVPTTTVGAIIRDLVIKNLGDAALTDRKCPNLIYVDAGYDVGTERQSNKYRFDNLGTALQELCNDAVDPTAADPAFTRLSFDLGYYLSETDGPVLLLTIGQTDKSSTIQFSKKLGTIRSYTVTRSRATANSLILGAGLQELTDDTTDPPTPIAGAARYALGLFEYSDIDAVYPGRIESFLDEGLKDPADEMDDDPVQFAQNQLALDKAAADAFTSGAGQSGATIVPRESPAQRYGVDYTLGTFCTVSIPRLSFIEQIREVNITLDASDAEKITISIGSAEGEYQRRSPGEYRRISDLQNYIDRLKVTK